MNIKKFVLSLIVVLVISLFLSSCTVRKTGGTTTTSSPSASASPEMKCGDTVTITEDSTMISIPAATENLYMEIEKAYKRALETARREVNKKIEGIKCPDKCPKKRGEEGVQIKIEPFSDSYSDCGGGSEEGSLVYSATDPNEDGARSRAESGVMDKLGKLIWDWQYKCEKGCEPFVNVKGLKIETKFRKWYNNILRKWLSDWYATATIDYEIKCVKIEGTYHNRYRTKATVSVDVTCAEPEPSPTPSPSASKPPVSPSPSGSKTATPGPSPSP